MARIFVLPSLIAPVAEGACFGGAEMAALALAEALARRGHRVTLLAPEGSFAEGCAVWTLPSTQILRPGGAAVASGAASVPVDPFPALFEALGRLAAAGELDVLHLHLIDPSALLAADRLARACPRTRVVSTLHVAAHFPETAETVRALLARATPVRFTAPSVYAASSYGRGIEVVPNGVELGGVAFVSVAPGDGRLVWAGRRSREKGLEAAVEIAARAGRPITICGPDPPEGLALGSGLALGPGSTDLGVLPRRAMGAVYGGAAATLVTSSIGEAHSLVAIESMAAGTPVIAFAAGALPEVVAHGETGFLVPPGDIEAAVRAVGEVGRIARTRCRQEAQARFDHERTVDRFLALYESTTSL